MWSAREGAPERNGKICSDVVVMDDQAVATGMPPGPMVSTLNVTKSSKVHIGPKIVSVTQNVHNTEMIKGHFMGLELVSSKHSRRVRCSVAVFICWALIVATGLIIYLIYVAMPKQTRLDIGLNETWYLRRGDWQAMPPYGVDFLQLPLSYVIIGHSGATSCKGRFNCIETVMDIQQNHFRRAFSDIGPNFLVGGEDGWLFEGRGANVFGAMVVAYNRISISIMFIELPLPKYLWNIVKNSSRTERLSCAAALLVLITCVTLIVYFTVIRTKANANEDTPPHSWNITREMWLATPYNDSLIDERFLPLMLVIVQHTVSGECTNFAQCAAELRTMQGWFLANKQYNIPYNFMIGNEGRVYEARGWNKEGAHTFGYNRCSMGIGFIGDYREERPHHSEVSELQLNRTKMLLEDGVRRGFLRPDFLIIGAKDVHSTASPGSNLYNALRKMDNFDHKGRFRNLNCEQIQEKYGNVTFD